MAQMYQGADEVWQAYFETRSVALRNRLVELYMPIVGAVVGKIAKRLPENADIDDLFSAGAMGLMETIERFDPARKVLPQTYLANRVRGAILDHLRSIDRVPRIIRERRKKIGAARDEFVAVHGRQPTRDELRAECKVSDAHFAKLEYADAVSVDDVHSLSASIEGGTEPGTYGDFIADNRSAGPLEVVERKDFVAYVIRLLPGAQAMFVLFYFMGGIPMKRIGRLVGMSESRISQLIALGINNVAGQCWREAA